MAYRRYARRRTTRRKTLSNYRIATRTGAKAQSRQIYALKKRINAIQNRTKPEIKIARKTASPITVSSATVMGAPVNFLLGSSGAYLPYFSIPLGATDSDYNNLAAGSTTNRFARQLSYTLFGDISYTNIGPTVEPCTLRVVILQSRATRANFITYGDVFSPAPASQTASSAVYGPLQTGLARTAKVLSDRRYYLSYQRPVVRIKTTLKRLMNYYRDTVSQSEPITASEDQPKGAIWVFYSLIFNGLEYTAEPTSNVLINFQAKLAYTDA